MPLKPGRVSMYHCGPTVYNFAHIGNLRAYIFDDTIRRGFEFLGYKVKQVINITDVGHLTSDRDTGEDKIEQGAKREHKTVQEIINFYSEAFFSDLVKLNVRTNGTKFPRATEHIKEQIALINILEEKGFTYKTSDGVYFDTSRFPAYGKLGQIDLTNLEEGARIGKHLEKKNPTDFALWKFAAAGTKREHEWPSPWGVGFPGWHIECSAMSMEYLGQTFDIHTGGIDHIPVHHNNEIAQSECATGQPYAHYWMHNAFVNIEHAKMSKSAGNFVRLATLEEHKIHPLAYRYWLLTAHYRSPVTFTFEAVSAAQNALESLVHKVVLALPRKKFFGSLYTSTSKTPKNSVENVRSVLRNHIENDLDTPGAIALLHKTLDEILAGTVHFAVLKDFDDVLGLNLLGLARDITKSPRDVRKIAKEREVFRKSNQWEQADALRKELENRGFFVKDTPTGPQILRSLATLI